MLSASRSWNSRHYEASTQKPDNWQVIIYSKWKQQQHKETQSIKQNQHQNQHATLATMLPNKRVTRHPAKHTKILSCRLNSKQLEQQKCHVHDKHQSKFNSLYYKYCMVLRCIPNNSYIHVDDASAELFSLPPGVAPQFQAFLKQQQSLDNGKNYTEQHKLVTDKYC